MDLTQSTDYMKLTENRLAEPFVTNDIVLFSGEIYKINRYWSQQKRILWVTTKYIINLKRDKDRVDAKGNPDLTGLSMKRIINVCNLKAVTKSLHEKSHEFVIHVPWEYDYRYSAKNNRMRDEIIQSLKLAYLSDLKDDLPIYGVPDRYLGKYTKTSNGKMTVTKIPDDKFILPEECIQINASNSVGPSFTLTKQLSMGSDAESFEVVEYEQKAKRNSKIKKSKSAEYSIIESERTGIRATIDTNVVDDYFSSEDEEKKIKDDISDDDLDISFNLDDEDIDLFWERSQTIYSQYDNHDKIKAKDFTLKKLLRSTYLGKVYLAEYHKNNKCYALKSVKKDEFMKRFQTLDVLKELNEQLKHPFICSIEYAFENEFRVYLVSELLKGGELESLLKKSGTLTEEQVKFYVAQIVHVLGYLHENNIVYRNLKTSNILINSNGYLKIGDFDSCKRMTRDQVSNSFLQLNEYHAPEILKNEAYDQSIDWWALGVVMSQMLFNTNVLINGVLKFPNSADASDESKDFITKLLEKDREKRLGTKNDKDEILEHKFFSGLDMQELLEMKIEPPYKPFIHALDPYFIANFNTELVKQPARESIVKEDEKRRISKEIEEHAKLTESIIEETA